MARVNKEGMKKEPASKAEWGPCYAPRAGNHSLAICDSFCSVLCVVHLTHIVVVGRYVEGTWASGGKL